MRLNLFLLFLIISHTVLSQKTPKVILVIADGIPADVIERLQPPNLMTIAREGVYKRAYVGGTRGNYTETPTISAPGYNDMLTGNWAYKHNVWNNSNQHPNYNYPTIFKLVRSAKPQADLAIFSTWIDNRTVLLGTGLTQTDALKINEVYDGYELDTLRFPHDKEGKYLHLIDEWVVRSADSVIRARGPDLSWIYLEYTDEVGHLTGTGAQFDSAVMSLDVQMKRITDAIHFREKNNNEKWLLLITTDHGRDAKTGKGHGFQSDRERTTWMIMNKKDANAYFASGDPAIVDVLPTASTFLSITIPDNIRQELDGTSMIGPVSVARPVLKSSGDSLVVEWQNFGKPEPVSILISYTNNYKTGGEDKYELLGTINKGENQFVKIIPGLEAHSFYKLIIRGKYNEVNVWKAKKL